MVNVTQTETSETGRARLRSDIIRAATALLSSAGPAAVTTRAVATGAGVQAPTIYRLFGDKDGLLDAVAEQVFASYVSQKSADEQSDDPVEDLRLGWETHLGFGLANPGLFALLADPHRGTHSPAIAAGLQVLRHRVHRLAVAGRLRVSERRAVEMIHAAGTGAVLTLLNSPEPERDPGLADAIYQATMRSIITDAPVAPAGDRAAAAAALRAALADVPTLSGPERALMAEWLDRIADS